MKMRPFFDQYEVLRVQKELTCSGVRRRKYRDQVTYDMDIRCTPGLWNRVANKQTPYEFSVSGERDWWHYSETKDGKLYRRMQGQPKLDNHDFFKNLMLKAENVELK